VPVKIEPLSKRHSTIGHEVTHRPVHLPFSSLIRPVSMTSVALAHQQCGEQVRSAVGDFNLLFAILKQDFDGSQDWVVVHNDVVAGSNPASGSRCRGSSVVEHENSQFISYPSIFQRAIEGAYRF